LAVAGLPKEVGVGSQQQQLGREEEVVRASRKI
jgi:hypothetical protein